jgi:hypothetical protein
VKEGKSTQAVVTARLQTALSHVLVCFFSHQHDREAILLEFYSKNNVYCNLASHISVNI